MGILRTALYCRLSKDDMAQGDRPSSLGGLKSWMSAPEQLIQHRLEHLPQLTVSGFGLLNVVAGIGIAGELVILLQCVLPGHEAIGGIDANKVYHQYARYSNSL